MNSIASIKILFPHLSTHSAPARMSYSLTQALRTTELGPKGYCTKSHPGPVATAKWQMPQVLNPADYSLKN
jgi:hypothetical protein